MTQIAIIQARMSSRRLPGKVLVEVAGKPLLGYLIESLRRCDAVDRAVVATSTAATDDPIVEWCQRTDVVWRRGPLEDVTQRYLQVASELGLPSFIRVNADSPLLVPSIVSRVVARFEEGNCDLATNVFPRTFPKGQSVEVIRTGALTAAAAHMTVAEDREHVTRYFYRHAQAFSICNVASDRDASSVQLSVDSPEDLQAFQDLLSCLTRPHWDYGLDELLTLRGNRALTH